MPDGTEPELVPDPGASAQAQPTRTALRKARSGLRRRLRAPYRRLAREELFAIKQLQVDYEGTRASNAALELEIEELADEVERLGGRVRPGSGNEELARFVAAAADEFGPTRDERRAALRELVGLLEELPDHGAPALDLASGRGEWLEILAERGIAATGVEHDDEVVAAGRARGLPSTESDVLDHLAGTPDASLGLVTAFRLVEHLAIAEALELVQGARRVLRPGGVLLIEGPDPRDPGTIVGLSLDPTTPRPRHPDLLEFCARRCGFDHVTVTTGPPADPTGVKTFVLIARA